MAALLFLQVLGRRMEVDLELVRLLLLLKQTERFFMLHHELRWTIAHILALSDGLLRVVALRQVLSAGFFCKWNARGDHRLLLLDVHILLGPLVVGALRLLKLVLMLL